MDISFHFYGVKVIAMLAGFDAVDAHRIASFSQYVDDYRPEKDSYVLEQVPYFARELVSDGRFYVVRTGFTVEGENIKFFDPVFLRDTVAAFHFIPPEDRITGKNYMVKRARCNDNSMAANILKNAASEYKKSRNAGERNAALLHTGIALHIFADTYAHENFNGFISGINMAEVTDARINGVRQNPYGIYHKLPKALAIGHARVGGAPDDAYAWFRVNQNGKQWERSNEAAFLECANEILDCLSYMKTGREPACRETMEAILRVGFRETNINRMPETWSQAWNGNPGIPYPVTCFYYSAGILNAALKPFMAWQGDRTVYLAGEDFYYYNFYAKRIRDYATRKLFEGRLF